MIYEVSHRTTYRYSVPVVFSHHLLHLTPRPCQHQTCRRTALVVVPTPTGHVQNVDFFGNPTTLVTLQDQHTELTLRARSVIEVRERPTPDPDSTDPWDRIASDLFADHSEAGLDAVQYSFESPYSVAGDDVVAYARDSFPPGRPLLAAAIDLTGRIFRDFKYEASATTVSTPVDQVLAGRRGVCQDFAHLEIACLRALRIPARYVSGYLLTRPPEGMDKLIGADASHAWLAVWCPGHGWVDLDPTNDLVVGDEHITLAWGRDYGDVSPINGAIYGGGAHEVEVAVDVTVQPPMD